MLNLKQDRLSLSPDQCLKRMSNIETPHRPDDSAMSIAADLKLSPNQTTLTRAIDCAGVALHSGHKIALRLCPAPAGSGIVFKRTDLAGMPEIKASWDKVVDTRMCTTLGNGEGVIVSTIEHLMAALSGAHVDNVLVELDGPEVPVMDGSAQPFIFLIECAGVEELNAPREVVEILKPVRVELDGKFAELLPSSGFSVGFEIEFDDDAVAHQEISVPLVNGSFKKEIARARTFGFLHEVEALRAAGLGLGGSLDNAVIVDGDKILNEGGLRFSDEFVRHKVLDAVGDLYLCGAPIRGHYRGFKAGHHLTNEVLKALFADMSAWRRVALSETDVGALERHDPLAVEATQSIAVAS